MDGQCKGYDQWLVVAVALAVGIPVITSSGVGKSEYFMDVFKNTPVHMALAAGIFHQKEAGIDEVKAYMPANGVPAQICKQGNDSVAVFMEHKRSDDGAEQDRRSRVYNPLHTYACSTSRITNFNRNKSYKYYGPCTIDYTCEHSSSCTSAFLLKINLVV
mmetsp:Transcript_22965/g.45866  ORF Transcript_22965/g.45866 Transcript_22965/m.45866 type:complete len:160 (+) Transcript_22965:1646-2125(+)